MRVRLFLLAALLPLVALTPRQHAVPGAPTSALVAHEPPASAAAHLTGRWRGAFVRENAVQELILDFEFAGEAFSGTYTIPALGLFAEPLRDVVFEPPRLQFATIYGHFECAHHADLSEIVGENSRWGPPVRLHVSASDLPDPWRREEVRFESDGLALAGTLVVPTSAGPHAAIVVVAGSEPRGRYDGASGWAYRGWGEALACRGIATLVYDRRGVGASEGRESDCDLATVARDARAAARFLRGHVAIDARKVGLLGTSQGGWTAPMAAVDDPEIAFLVLVVPPAVDVATQELDAVRALLTSEDAMGAGITEEHVAAAQAFQRHMFEVAYGEREWSTLESAVEGARSEPWSAFVELPESEEDLGWWRANRYDPAATLKRLRQPVLAIFGELDGLVPPSTNRPLLERYLREGGNESFETVTLAGVGHGLERYGRLVGDDWKWPGSFWVWGGKSPELYSTVHQWVRARGLVPARESRHSR